jgi:HrpA-like RNA helicase
VVDTCVPYVDAHRLFFVVAQILALDLGNPYHFLRSAISPPDDVAITNGVLFLESLSAVVVNNFDTSLNVEGKDISIDLDCEITPLGYHLAALPINPRIGKLILYGVLLHCIDPILTIAGTESVKSVFTAPFGAKELADEAKLRFLEGNSDLLTSSNAFSTWKTTYDGGRKGGAGRDGPSEGDFCRANFLSFNSLRLVDQMRQQFLGLLKDIGFMPADVTLANIAQCPQNSYGRHIGLLKCAICAGLSPNILLASDLNGKNAGKKLAEIALQSRSQGTMKVHPSSVMSEAKCLDSPYIVYLEAMRTSQVYVRDVTTIPGLVLTMFSGRSKVNPYNGAVVVDGWLRFRTPNLRTASCIARIRDGMEDAFMQKVLEPASETSAKWMTVLRCIERIVSAT